MTRTAVEGPAGDGDARAVTARRSAAADRRSAAEDREAGAVERGRADEVRRSARGAGRNGPRPGAAGGGDDPTVRTAAADRPESGLDALTGVLLREPGLREVDRRLARARSSGHELIGAFAAVDALGAVNRAHGRPAGDRVLVAVASTIRANLRPSDLVVRHGGDEFLCVVAGLPARALRRRLDLVQATLAAGPASISVGVATLRAGEDTAAFVARAGAELRQGRGEPGPAHAADRQAANVAAAAFATQERARRTAIFTARLRAQRQSER
jgi:diguanylate cyclase (GGDEF)-like protein